MTGNILAHLLSIILNSDAYRYNYNFGYFKFVKSSWVVTQARIKSFGVNRNLHLTLIRRTLDPNIDINATG